MLWAPVELTTAGAAGAFASAFASFLSWAAVNTGNAAIAAPVAAAAPVRNLRREGPAFSWVATFLSSFFSMFFLRRCGCGATRRRSQTPDHPAGIFVMRNPLLLGGNPIPRPPQNQATTLV